jgi:uncharacterized protein YkwD
MAFISIVPLAAKAFAMVGLTTACAVNPTVDVHESSRQAPVVTRAAPMEEGEAAPVRRACIPPVSGERKDLVCHRWTCDHSGLEAATWDGDPTSCSAGRIDDNAEAKALGIINTYRFLAGVPAIAAEPEWAEPAQDCALLAHANNALSHEPPTSWSCYSDRGARASAVSLIANRSAPLAIDAFMEDPGNESTMVHRRWLLTEAIHRLALGSTSKFACIVVDGRQYAENESASAKGESPATTSTDSATRPTWVAWPPSGPVPIDALQKTKVDATGWTVQSSTYDLEDAAVEVSLDGRRLPIIVSSLERTLGSRSALRFVPKGWSTEAGRRYEVRVIDKAIQIAFTVEPVTCS